MQFTLGGQRPLHQECLPVELWEERSQLLRAMAHPVRLQILKALCEGPLCVKDVNSLFDISQPHLSQHMAALRKNNLVDSHVNGTLRCYYLLMPSLVKSQKTVTVPTVPIYCAGKG